MTLNYIDFLLLAVIGALVLLAVLPVLTREPGMSRSASCQNNLKQFGIVCKLYAGKSNGHFPPLGPENGLHMLAKAVYPEHLRDLYICICPCAPAGSAPDPSSNRQIPEKFITDDFYTYLGYVVTNDTELEAFAKAYKDRVAKGLPFDSDLDVAPGAGLGGGCTIPRLREGVENALTLDASADAAQRAKSTIPVMWDRCRYDPKTEPEKWFNHKPAGANVLYMDGHVEFIKYPGKFPLTENACRILDELHKLKSDAHAVAKPEKKS